MSFSLLQIAMPSLALPCHAEPNLA